VTEILELQGMEPTQYEESFASTLSFFCVVKA
jgi:hypothetical protein